VEAKAAATVAKQVKLVYLIIGALCIVIAGMGYFGWSYLTRVSPVEDIRSVVVPVGHKPPSWVATVYGEANFLLSNPRKVHVSGNEILVADTGNGRIVIFDYTGNYLRKFGDQGEEGDEGRLIFPYSIATVGEEILVADAGLNKVAVFGKDGGFRRYFAEELFVKPVDITYTNGKLYFTDVGTHEIIVTDATGTETLRFGGPGKSGDGVFWFPNGVAALPDGRILVADTNNSRLQFFDEQGNFLESWQGDIERGQATFASPSDIAIDKNGNIYVADPLTRRVMVVDHNGETLGPVNVVGEPDEKDSLEIPSGLAIDARQRLYVADYGASRLVIYDLK
jgi:DNA-binding beta-propeller fold protein YncE